MTIKLPRAQTGNAIVLPLPRRPLGHADHVFVQRAVADIAAEWSVELQDDDAEATLIVVPEDGDDALGPSFMISREACGFRVNQVHWDMLTEVGMFASLNDAVTSLRARLTLWSGLAAASSTTVH